MTVIKTRDIEKALLSKGFKRADSDHRYYFFYVDGKKTSVRTKISHGISEYGDTLLSKMKDQMHLSKKELEEFIECSLSVTKYQAILIEKEIVIYP